MARRLLALDRTVLTRLSKSLFVVKSAQTLLKYAASFSRQMCRSSSSTSTDTLLTLLMLSKVSKVLTSQRALSIRLMLILLTQIPVLARARLDVASHWTDSGLAVLWLPILVLGLRSSYIVK